MFYGHKIYYKVEKKSGVQAKKQKKGLLPIAKTNFLCFLLCTHLVLYFCISLGKYICSKATLVVVVVVLVLQAAREKAFVCLVHLYYVNIVILNTPVNHNYTTHTFTIISVSDLDLAFENRHRIWCCRSHSSNQQEEKTHSF